MPFKIVVTGPESSGKTQLCTRLSALYKGTMIPEFARDYLKKFGHNYKPIDIEHIAQGQAFQNQVLSGDNSLYFCDTDALTSYIWMEDKFMLQSTKLSELLVANRAHFYLLCFPDLPWEYDPLRENPLDRDRIFKHYLMEIHRFRFPYAVISGSGIGRINLARYYINNFLTENNHSYLVN